MFRYCKTSICPRHPMFSETSQQVLLDPVALASLLNRLEQSNSSNARLERRAGVGSYLTLTRLDWVEQLEIQLVEPSLSQPSQGRISFLSPLGSALIGLRPGHTATIDCAEGKSRWMITDVAQRRGDS
ncbi:transcription elongation factor GreAB [Aliidiomarina sedimenti]|uniref:Transcription elongation factor GreAB n=2 Tax=Aliidiomarina sedimenti TaxID=1933879 RepID=A0ABY0BX69_9GAMM|nr:transcription elongation factor GreAB [Aliidiomarina sedimenti]